MTRYRGIAIGGPKAGLVIDCDRAHYTCVAARGLPQPPVGANVGRMEVQVDQHVYRFFEHPGATGLFVHETLFGKPGPLFAELVQNYRPMAGHGIITEETPHG